MSRLSELAQTTALAVGMRRYHNLEELRNYMRTRTVAQLREEFNDVKEESSIRMIMAAGPFGTFFYDVTMALSAFHGGVYLTPAPKSS